jgi:hypothetical protein
MKPVLGPFLVALTAVSGAISGCQTDTTPTPSATTSAPRTVAAGAPTTSEELCNAQAWPRPLPQVVGLVLGQATSGALICFDNVRALAPGGHDVMNDKGPTGPWRITAISPAGGTPVGKADQVTLELAPEDPTAPPAFRPCDWVTTTEAANFLGVQSVSAWPVGDEAGSVSQSCDYSSGSDFVTSDLQLPGSYAVDARSEFGMAMAAGSGIDVSGLPGPAYCGTPKGASGKGSAALTVLLSGDRIYRAFGAPCDTLKKFAQTAIPRIEGS